ncbi:MAG TPA: hypothetical protein VGK86_03660 [Thermoanaerobaculia bacterium]
MTRRSAFLALLLATALCPRALSETISLWGGGGAGSLTARAARDVEGHKFGALAVSLSGDRLRIRYVQGSLEREKELPPRVGDDDVDYLGLDGVLTQKLTSLPVDVAIGFARFEEASPPRTETGHRTFEHRWGPHASFLRAFPLWKHVAVWTELDVHYAPYRARQIIAVLDAGIGFHL